jgi:tRNA (cmo5U34)-methyltransferase
MGIGEAFNQTIRYYDDWMKKALPNYDDLFGTARELIPFEKGAAIDVLDLGAGTGLFSSHVLACYPQAKFVLYDIADQMLEVAKQRFGTGTEQFCYRVGDYRNIELGESFDLVVSSLSIHHLNDAEKETLFKRIYGLLRSGGVFINVDQVRGESEYIRKLYWDHWLAQVRRMESSDEKINESINRRKTYDQEATLANQLDWLKGAGFVNVDCVYKNYFVGVFFGMKE